MGASEDRATLREHERQARASEVEEMMIPGYGIWTATGVKQLLDERDLLRKLEDELPHELGTCSVCDEKRHHPLQAAEQ